MPYKTAKETFLGEMPRGVVKVILEGQFYSDVDNPITVGSLVVLDTGKLRMASSHVTAVTGFEAKFAGVALTGSKTGEVKLVTVGLVIVMEAELHTNAVVTVGDQVGPTLAGGTAVHDTKLDKTATEAIGRVVKSSQLDPLGVTNDRATVILFANGFALA